MLLQTASQKALPRQSSGRGDEKAGDYDFPPPSRAARTCPKACAQQLVAAQGCPELPQADLKALPSPSHREATTTDQAQAHQQLLKTPLTPTVPQLQEKGSPSPAGCSGGSSNSVVARVPAVVGKACVYSMADRASESVRSKGPGGGGLTKFARKRFAEANTTQPASKHWRLGYALTVWLAS
ncbi:hypothetical protein ABBQ32_001848 [Trebouxia sp. C0010 RCD-2024]